MIDRVLHLFAQDIAAELPIFSKTGGQVRPVKINDGSKIKTVPASVSADPTEAVVHLSPDSRESGILWFEAGPTRVGKEIGGVLPLENDVRLVAWLNLKKIAPPDTSLVVAKLLEIMRAEFSPTAGHALRNRTTVFLGDVPTDPSIFSRWDFAEAESQFLLPPFDFFALNFRVHHVWSMRCEQPPVLKIDPQC